MTIDQRLEKLTERHEALTQSVEFIAHMQIESEKKFTERFERLMAAVERVTDATVKLADVVTNHERRLDNLDDSRS